MREYKAKNNVQGKAYYNDRFWVAPQIPSFDVASDEIFSEQSKKLNENFDVIKEYIQAGHYVVEVASKDNKDAVGFFKDELGYNFLIEIVAVDFLADRGVFEIVYEMLSTATKKRARIKCCIKEKEALESVNDHFRMADWSEREMFDLSGVKINNHPYMKRIIMPDDWQGHPLRKDYPMVGDEAAQWYEIDQIFGKDYRDVIGPENRDQARVDRFDTERYAKLKHEVGRGEKFSDTPTDFGDYQEKDGVFLIKKLKKENTVQLEERK